MFFAGKPSNRVGLLINGSTIHAAEYRWHDGWHKVWSNSEKLPFSIFGKGSVSESESGEIEKAIHRVANPAIKKNRLVNVAIADPAVHYAFFEQKSVPKKQSDQTELCRSRFAKQGSLDVHSMAIAFQYENGSDDQYSIMAMGLENRWLDVLQKVFIASGLRVGGFVPNVVAQFNQHYARLTEGRRTSAMIAIHDAYWSTLIWDEKGSLRYCRSLWRNSEEGSDIRRILEDIERITKSYARGDTSKAVRKFFITGDGADSRLLLDLMRSKLLRGAPADSSAEGAGSGDRLSCLGSEDVAATAAALGNAYED